MLKTLLYASASILMLARCAVADGTDSTSGACSPALAYELVKTACLMEEPSSEEGASRMMSGFGLEQHGTTWKCHSESGDFIASYLPAKRWVFLDYTPAKGQRVPDVLLTTLAAASRFEFVGPSWVRFDLKAETPQRTKSGSSAVVVETVTIGFATGEHEDTQCTVRYSGP